MIYLLLAICSSALISIGMRASEGRASNNLGMLAVNYFICAILARLCSPQAGLIPEGGGGNTLLLGIISGFFYLAGFILFQWNVSKNGVVLSATFMKLGVLVPTLLSVIVFDEVPSALQVAGFAGALCAILLIHFESSGTSRAQTAWGLPLLLLGGGMADSMSKIFEELGHPSQKDRFLFYAFLTALILCLALMVGKKQRIGRAELFFGSLVGIPNYFSALFLLLALDTVPAVVVFPTFSVGTIVAVSCAGLLLFRETLSRRRVFAIGIILLSLVLLNL